MAGREKVIPDIPKLFGAKLIGRCDYPDVAVGFEEEGLDITSGTVGLPGAGESKEGQVSVPGLSCVFQKLLAVPWGITNSLVPFVTTDPHGSFTRFEKGSEFCDVSFRPSPVNQERPHGIIDWSIK